MFLLKENKTATNSNKTYIVHEQGVQYIRAFKMAIDDINNRTMYKNAFPNVTLKSTIYATTIPFIDDVKASLYQNAEAFGKKGIIAQVVYSAL